MVTKLLLEDEQALIPFTRSYLIIVDLISSIIYYPFNMSDVEHGFILPLPINDTGDLLTHTDKVWGRFALNERGHIGGVRPDEITGIANDWVKACNDALIGAKIIQRAITEGVVTPDLYSLKMYNALARALKGIPEEEKAQIIENARTAFMALNDSTLELDQEDVDAAQALVAGLDPLYQVREISVVEQS